MPQKQRRHWYRVPAGDAECRTGSGKTHTALASAACYEPIVYFLCEILHPHPVQFSNKFGHPKICDVSASSDKENERNEVKSYKGIRERAIDVWPDSLHPSLLTSPDCWANTRDIGWGIRSRTRFGMTQGGPISGLKVKPRQQCRLLTLPIDVTAKPNKWQLAPLVAVY